MQNQFEYWEDQRTSEVSQLTDQLADALSRANFSQLQHRQINRLHANSNVLTLLIHGLPPNDQEFKGFVFTKRTIVYYLPGTDPKASAEQHVQRLEKASPAFVVEEIDSIVEAYGGQVIIASHSFGSYFSTLYAAKYSKKVKGLIELGAVPVRFYPILKVFGQSLIFSNPQYKTQAQWIAKADELYAKYLEQMKYLKGIVETMKCKYMYVAFFILLTREMFKTFWVLRRKPTNILRLIVYGGNDSVFPPSYLKEAAVHFTYGPGQLSEQTNQKHCIAYKQITGQTVKNVQSRFVFGFEKTGHAVHLRKKVEIQKLIDLYLSVVLNDSAQKPAL